MHGRRCHAGIMLLNAAHHHAKMDTFDHHTHPLRMKQVTDKVCDLAGHPFLNLQSAGENIHNSRNFGKPQDFSIRDISHMDTPPAGGRLRQRIAVLVLVWSQPESSKPQITRWTHLAFNFLTISLPAKVSPLNMDVVRRQPVCDESGVGFTAHQAENPVFLAIRLVKRIFLFPGI